MPPSEPERPVFGRGATSKLGGLFEAQGPNSKQFDDYTGRD
jgi:hypothetical protein